MSQTILKERQNCWRIMESHRLKFLVDAASYFKAVKEAVRVAQESVFVIGWDINSQICLDHEYDDDSWKAFSELLLSIVTERPGLNVYLLGWDYAVIYLNERESFARIRWDIHPRIHFRFDNYHPAYACHHQKMVVVDDSIAFIGGIDLTAQRWDTPRHDPQDSRRSDLNGHIHHPIHDVQVAIDGETAAAVGELARNRWTQLTGESLAPSSRRADAWPPNLIPDMTDTKVGIARTVPAFDGTPAIRQVEQLYKDCIAAAKRFIYLENQYVTSATIGEALARRLEEQRGPEIVMVIHKEYTGWTEAISMGILRSRLFDKLERADHEGRLRVYYPENKGVSINVHSKVLIFDDAFARVGSSNLSNRSMGLDTECDVAVEASHTKSPQAIGRFLDRLVSEHLGVNPDEFRHEFDRSHSLIQAIEDLRGGPRSLVPLDVQMNEWLNRIVPATPLLDPDRPFTIRNFLKSVSRDRKLQRLIAGAGVIIGLSGFGAYKLTKRLMRL